MVYKTLKVYRQYLKPGEVLISEMFYTSSKNKQQALEPGTVSYSTYM